MKLQLQQINTNDPDQLGFTITFYHARIRLLLAYPHARGIIFNSVGGGVSEWGTPVLTHEPLDTFVLNPDDEISFTLRLKITKAGLSYRQWNLKPAATTTEVFFEHQANPSSPACDAIFKRRCEQGSRLHGSTPWEGQLRSAPIPIAFGDNISFA